MFNLAIANNFKNKSFLIQRFKKKSYKAKSISKLSNSQIKWYITYSVLEDNLEVSLEDNLLLMRCFSKCYNPSRKLYGIKIVGVAFIPCPIRTIL